MTEAGHSVIRIAESTWSRSNHPPGVFDFTHGRAPRRRAAGCR